MRRGGEPDIGATLRLAHIPGDGITRFAMRKVRSELTRITVLYVLRFCVYTQTGDLQQLGWFLESQ
jgi:hypothetical protein